MEKIEALWVKGSALVQILTYLKKYAPFCPTGFSLSLAHDPSFGWVPRRLLKTMYFPGKRIFRIRVTVLSAICAVFIFGCGPKGEEKFFFEAEQALIAGNYDSAIEKFTDFVTHYPGSEFAAESQYRIGYIHSRHLRDAKSAMDAYAILFRLYPKSPQVAFAREDMAAIYSSSGEERKAIGEYARLMENGPSAKKDFYRYQIAMGYIRLNDFRQARIEFEEILKTISISSSPLKPQAKLQIANTHYLEGNMDEAVKAYDRVMSDYKGDSVYADEAKLAKASVLAETGMLKEALVLLIELKEEYPNKDVLGIKIDSTLERLRHLTPGQHGESESPAAPGKDK
ncbi:MAG: tetratricopeptide repeat protein [Thermodesulfobacteriota bacterium]